MLEKSEGRKAIEGLDIKDKQTLVDLLLAVQCGNVSCRRAATEIMTKVEEYLNERTKS